jgi:hypothetical protein
MGDGMQRRSAGAAAGAGLGIWLIVVLAAPRNRFVDMLAQSVSRLCNIAVSAAV